MNSLRCFLKTKIQARTARAHSALWAPWLERPPPPRERLPRPLCFEAVPSQPYQMLSPEPRSEGGVLTHLPPASLLLPRQAPSPKRKHLDTLSLAKLVWKFGVDEASRRGWTPPASPLLSPVVPHLPWPERQPGREEKVERQRAFSCHRSGQWTSHGVLEGND